MKPETCWIHKADAEADVYRMILCINNIQNTGRTKGLYLGCVLWQ